MLDLKIQSMLEAVLFAVGDPIEVSKLASALEIDEIVVEENLGGLSKRYNENDGGIKLLRLENRVRLVSNLDYAKEIRAVLRQKKNAPLSRAAFEVLAIIAYNQPVTKSFVERVRGVDCSGVIGSLCTKELIEEKGRLDLPGRPLVYGTTPNFLRCFNMESLGELPKIPEDESEDDLTDEAEEAKNESEGESENNNS